MQKQNILRGFTLVELIVVITIVGILSTVGFVSYSGYLTGARDSNRISQMVKLSDSLQVYSTTKSLPFPDDYVTVTASGETIGYQGNIGVDVLETIDYTNGGTDPKDDSYYTYYLTKDRKSMQLLALMEDQQSVALNSSLTQVNAQFEDRFPKVYGRKLGVYTESETNSPIQELSAYDSNDFDVVLETNEFISHISDDEKLEGTGSTLMASSPDGSCNRIKQTGGASGNGEYTISPAGEDFDVYCDMEISGGGWTMIARSVAGGTGNFGWSVSTGEVNEDDSPYSLGSIYQKLNFEQVLLMGYSTGKNQDNYIYTFESDTQEIINQASNGYTASCNVIEGFDGGTTCSGLSQIGNSSGVALYMFSSNNTQPTRGLYPYGHRHSGDSTLNDVQGMIFVK